MTTARPDVALDVEDPAFPFLSARVRTRQRGEPVGKPRGMSLLDRNAVRKLDLRFAQTKNIEAIKALHPIADDLNKALYGGPVAERWDAAVPVVGKNTAELVPWEALDVLLDANVREYYAPVRIVDVQSPYTLSTFDEPMRLVFILGHPDGAFDPQMQQERVRTALEGLDRESRGRIASPGSIPTIDLASGTESDWSATLAAAQPHVVLYFGHGMGGDAPALRVGPGDDGWVPLQNLVNLVQSAGARPPFWAFLACSLGETNTSPHLLTGPRAFEIVRTGGALAMLAMRVMVRVDLAELLIRAVIERLAAGDSLETATAFSRRAVQHSKRIDAKNLADWAAVRVWSSGQPVPRLTWGAAPDTAAAFTAMQLMRKAANDVGRGLEPPPPWAVARAKRWREIRRVRLIVDAVKEAKPATGVITLIESVLAADRRERGSTVLWIKLPASRSQNVPSRLEAWAATIRPRLAPSFADDAVVHGLELLQHRNVEGLRVLLSLPDVIAVFSDTPTDDPSDAPVWTEILSAPESATIVLCDRKLRGDERLRDWTDDRIVDRPYDDANIEALLKAAPESTALLAVLGVPIALEALSQAAHEKTHDLAGSPILIDEAAGGVVMIDSARSYVRKRAGADAIRRAHDAYLRARAEIVAFQLIEDWSEDVAHFIGAERWGDLAEFVDDLARREGPTWNVLEWVRLGLQLEPAGPALDGISPEVLLTVAAALIERQDTARAMVWILRATPSNELQAAWRSAMLSEAYKSDPAPGSRELMWSSLQDALDRCNAILHMSPDDADAAAALREYELSWARLELYFKHRAEAAKATFERLIDGWNKEIASDPVTARPRLARPLAAALRNVAECLFEFEPFAGDATCRNQAERYLEEARTLARDEGLRGVDAEIEYSYAKCAEAAGDRDASIERLATCAKLANDAPHYLVFRIAQLRRYRLQVEAGLPFSAVDFQGLVSALDYFDWHAWAMRFAAQSRIWAARRLAAADEPSRAVALLRANRALSKRPGLQGKTDRMVIARTYAGIALVGADPTAWAEFQKLSWAADWLRDQSMDTPQAVWEVA